MGKPWEKYQAQGSSGIFPVGPADPTRPATIREKTNQAAASDYSPKRARNEANASDLDPAIRAETLRRARLENEKLAQQRADEAAARSIQPNSNKHGEAYLADKDPGLAAQIRGVATGNISLGPRPFSNPQSLAILKHVVNYDPTYDMTDFAGRAKANQAFRTGPQGQNLTALNTALEHANTVKRDIDALGNSSGLVGAVANPLRNTWRHIVDDPRPANLTNDMRAFGGEAEKVFVPNGGTEGGRASWQDSIPVNAGPNTQNSILKHDAELFKSRLEALEYQARQALGPNAHISDFLSPEARQAYDQLLANGGATGGQSQGGPVPGAPGGPPPTIGGPPLPPSGSGGPGGAGPNTWRNMPNAGPQLAPATGSGPLGLGASMRSEFDPIVAKNTEALIRAGKSPQEVNDYLNSVGHVPVDPKVILANQAYLKANPQYGNFVQATKEVPTTLGERVSATPFAAGAAGALDATTAGWDDEIGGRVSQLFGGDYEKTRNVLDANKIALSSAHPYANLAGNVIGGAASLVGGEAALASRFAPKGVQAAIAAARGSKVAPFLPALGDAAYGAAYGAGQSNDDRLGGALKGGVAAAAGGMMGRGIMDGAGSAIAPSGGKLAPLYEQGVFPTLGQRASAAQGPISKYLGKAYGKVEEGLQSLPIAGFLPFRARQIPRDQFQLGAFNSALGEIGDQLPAAMKPGNEPHVYAHSAFKNAYDNARSGMNFVPDQQFGADHAAWSSAVDNGILSGEQAQQVKKVVNNAVGSRLTNSGGHLPGAPYKAAASDLSDAARAWSKSDPDKANALNSYIDIFDNAARRNSHPDAVTALDNADRGYAKFVRVQDAASARGGDSGTFSPAQFDRSIQRNSSGVRSSAYNQGDALMQDYGDAGKHLGDSLPNSGTYDRLAIGQAATGVGSGGMVGMGIPMVGAAKAVAPLLAPYAPGLNYLATRAIAPRSALGIDPALAAAIDVLGTGVKNRAGMMGRVTAPALAAYNLEP